MRTRIVAAFVLLLVIGGARGLPAEARSPVVSYVYALDKPPVLLPPEMAREAYRILSCESKHKEGAVNRLSGAIGLWQIHPVHKERVRTMGFTWSDMTDAKINTMGAGSLWYEIGLEPWKECLK